MTCTTLLKKINIQIIQYVNEHQRPVNAFYKRNKTNVSCNKNDVIYVATHDSSIVAAVFVRSELLNDNGAIPVLRSLYVEKTYRNRGIGAKLVKHCCLTYPSTLYLFTAPDLELYYNQLGFNREIEIQKNQLPKQYKKGLLLMSKP